MLAAESQDISTFLFRFWPFLFWICLSQEPHFTESAQTGKKSLIKGITSEQISPTNNASILNYCINKDLIKDKAIYGFTEIRRFKITRLTERPHVSSTRRKGNRALVWALQRAKISQKSRHCSDSEQTAEEKVHCEILKIMQQGKWHHVWHRERLVCGEKCTNLLSQTFFSSL